MMQKALRFKVSIGEVFLQDVENGIVNFGIAAQRNIVKSVQGSSKDVQPANLNKSNLQVKKHG